MPLDAPLHRYFPYYIDDVYRCSGSCGSVSPDISQCVVKTQNNVTGDVLELATRTLKRITVVNDTSCECACVTKAGDCSENEEFVENRCSCQCKYPDQPPTPCPERFSWNPFRCECECAGPVEFCPPVKEWSHQKCGCICTRFAVEVCKSEKKFLNATTCECEDPVVKQTGPGVTGKRTAEGTNWKLFSGILAAIIIVLIVVYDVYLYRRHKDGVFHWMFRNCSCHRKGNTRSAQPVTSNNGTTVKPNADQNHSPSIRNNEKRAESRV